MKYLITGAAGFIGSTVSNHLYNLGHELVLIDNLSFGNIDNFEGNKDLSDNLIKQDIRDDLTSLFEGVDIVLHFAAITSLPYCQSHPRLAYDVNVNGSINILENCRNNNIKKIILASTSAIYENCSTYPFKEELEVNPTLIYSMTKKTAEDIFKSYRTNYGLNTVSLRFFNVFGEHQDVRRVNPPFTSYLTKCAVLAQTAKLFNKSAAVLPLPK